MMKRLIPVLRTILLFLLVLPCLKAQQAESLLIAPGDLVHVQVFQVPELEQRSRVDDAGYLALIMGGSVKVAGMSPAGAARVIEQALLEKNLILHPSVLVTIDEYSTSKVSVFGQVKTPGAYQISTARSILDVLALAGGTTDVADRKVFIQRHGTGERITCTVTSQEGVVADAHILVYPGDTVIVPKAGIVYIMGDVRIPGGYTMTNNEAQLSVLQIVARAGGLNNSAIASHTRLLRKTSDVKGYTVIPLHVDDMRKGKVPDFYLQADDVLYVPFSYLKNLVTNGTSGLPSALASAAVYRF